MLSRLQCFHITHQSEDSSVVGTGGNLSVHVLLDGDNSITCSFIITWILLMSRYVCVYVHRPRFNATSGNQNWILKSRRLRQLARFFGNIKMFRFFSSEKYFYFFLNLNPHCFPKKNFRNSTELSYLQLTCNIINTSKLSQTKKISGWIFYGFRCIIVSKAQEKSVLLARIPKGF